MFYLRFKFNKDDMQYANQELRKQRNVKILLKFKENDVLFDQT